ncbi:pyridine nucleotide-disulfide oxidoreductase [Microbacterium sorbitolivorans]|uniref:NAD(P)/FAD-dependent oxidoreductase n=1 Tax=Microbacterium sorbitolivorans TaxID=1867410 RepID=A0A367Y8M9_9MICO|nr:FAD-dependent oxidoreductase [Microbacterium sorbitolivorans]RCK61402.1 NAD(P)/FAD-dependent oxidoreductase [Microbacterium sorbitolivorans]GGF32547.1 pyridine nucleotide-disulfide oxidoreductase [Microbacterium sorbitolivorans]
MSTPENVVIIGGGLAGAKTAEALREREYAGAVTLVAAEEQLPYERPPLSKDYLAGKAPFDDAAVHTAEWYTDNRVDLRLGVRATGIDAADHRVTLDDGTALPYDKLVLATGSAVRRLPLDGADAENVHYLRTVEDSDAIRASFGDGKRLVIIGGGWIGLEVASSARAAGTTVTVLEGSSLTLLRVLGDEVARVFAGLHRSNGVDLRTEAKVSGIVTDGGRATGVRLEGGETIPADAIVIGIGVSPVTEIAEAAGLAVDNGVLVDASLRTSDPDVYAVGDIANHDHPVLGHRIRVERWATALNQPAVAAAALLGDDVEYTELPYFFTDQYDLGCEYIGHANGAESEVVIRGDLESREFVAFWLDEHAHIQAAMNVNVWDVIDEIKPLIAERRVVDPKRLADPAVPFARL